MGNLFHRSTGLSVRRNDRPKEVETREGVIVAVAVVLVLVVVVVVVVAVVVVMVGYDGTRWEKGRESWDGFILYPSPKI